MKGKSFNNLRNDVRLWEERMTFDRQKPKKKIHWGAPNLPEQWRHFRFEKEYIIEEINNSDDLFDESRIMRHCVLSYLDQCIYDGTRIFSMKISSTNAFKKMLIESFGLDGLIVNKILI